MIISLRKWKERVKFLVLFVMITYLLFHVLQMVYEYVTPFDKDHKPGGNAVKVFEQLREGDGEVMFKDRLLFFLWYGE